MSESELTIRSLGARAVAAPLARPLRTASGNVPVSPLLLIDVVSEEGPAGRACIFGYTTLVLLALKAFVDDLDEVLRGRPACPAAVTDGLAARFWRTAPGPHAAGLRWLGQNGSNVRRMSSFQQCRLSWD